MADCSDVTEPPNDQVCCPLRNLSAVLGLVLLGGMIVGLALLYRSGSQWRHLQSVYASVADGDQRATIISQIDLDHRVIAKDDPDWDSYTRWVLSEEEQRRATTVVFYESGGGFGPAPSQCALYFDGDGRLVKKSIDN